MRHLDLMDLLAMYQPKNNAPLDAMAKLCGFPGKLGMDGSAVYPAYLAGQLDDIRRYCESFSSARRARSTCCNSRTTLIGRRIMRPCCITARSTDWRIHQVA